MATPLENIQTAIQSVSEQIASYSALISVSGNDQTGYSIENQSVTKKDIFSKLESLNARLLQLLELQQILDGPFEVHSYGVPL